MFTCAKIKATKGKGADFYRRHLSCNDYFSEHESVPGVWRGSLAEDFRLSDQSVTQDQFRQFQQNIHPQTGRRLTARNVAHAVRFYDFQCSAQKSVSVVALFDERLVQAHREAVRLGMQEMERFAAVRLREGAHAHTNNCEITGNFLYAEYHHDTSRLLDPQLHTHNVIVNVTRDHSGKYKALQNQEMLKAIRYANKVYLNALARSCLFLGYEIEPKFRENHELVGFEIKGVDPEILTRCSRRRAQIDREIEAFTAKVGRRPTPEEVQRIALATRDRKMLTRTNAEVKNFQKDLLSPEEQAACRTLEDNARQFGAFFAPRLSLTECVGMLEKVAKQLFERETVITLDKLLAETLNQNLGQMPLERLQKAIRKVPWLVNLGKPEVNPYLTTRPHLEREAEILQIAHVTKESVPPIRSGYVPFSEETDGFDHSAQKRVIEDLLNSRGRFQMFRGVAGAGKTTTLRELCKCLTRGGVKDIHVIAPTNSAVDVLRQEGFASAQTVAKFLLDPKTLPPPGAYVIVDESGLNSVEQGHAMMQLALKNRYRILFVGDERQHSSVEAGDFFRLLERFSDVPRTELAEIHRQKPEAYRHGIELAARGETEAAFEQLDKAGFIHENRGSYLDAAAESFLRLTDDGRKPLDCIAAAPTNRECGLLTEKIRDRLKRAGRLDETTERDVTAFHSWNWTKERIADIRNYRPGMKIFLTSRVPGVGNAGEMFEVAKVDGPKLRLTDGRSLYLSQIRDRLAVGEARTLKIAQGDVIRMTVNLRTPEYKIHNGSLAIATGRPNEFTLLDHERKALATVQLPTNFRGFKYGWVMTSHAAQGMTAKNVVAAAENMSAQSFYVACSRGRQELALHVPEKEFFRNRLIRAPGKRLLVADVLPPRPVQVIGPQLREILRRMAEKMRQIHVQISAYISVMYQTLNHNRRRKDDERNEQFRKHVRLVAEQHDVERRNAKRRLAEQQRELGRIRPAGGAEEARLRLVALAARRKQRHPGGFDR